MMPNVLHSEIWYVTKNSSFENELPHKSLCHSFGSSSCLLGWYEFTLIQSLSRLLLICILTSWGKCPLCTSHCWWQNLFLGMLSWVGKQEPFCVRVLQGACCHMEGPQHCCLGEMKYILAQMDKVILFQLEKKITCWGYHLRVCCHWQVIGQHCGGNFPPVFLLTSTILMRCHDTSVPTYRYHCLHSCALTCQTLTPLTHSTIRVTACCNECIFMMHLYSLFCLPTT